MKTMLVRNIFWECHGLNQTTMNYNIRQEGNMIYTVTLNPPLGRTVWVKDDSNRIEREQRYAGGKGIDESKVLTSFGISNKMFGIKIMRLKRCIEDFRRWGQTLICDY